MTVVKQLGAAGGLTSSTPGGTLSSVFSTDPSSATHWSSYATIWDEYRVLGTTIEYEPDNKYTFVNRRGYVTSVLDMDDASSALVSNAAAAAYATHRFHNLSDHFRVEMKCSGSNQLAYVSTAASPDQVGSIKLFSDNLTAAVVLGFYIQTWLVQFRGSY